VKNPFGKWKENLFHSVQLDRIEKKVDRIITMEEFEMATLDDILSGVQEESTLIDSVIVILNNIKAQLDPAAAAKMQTIIDQITANKTKTQDVITANTSTP